MIETNKIIVFPHLRGRIPDNPVNISNVAIKDVAAEQPDNYIYDCYENINSEINNIISNIHGESQLIELYVQDEMASDKNHLSKSIDSIKNNCLRLTKFSSNMIDLKRINNNKFCLYVNNVNIIEVIEDIVLNVSNNIKDKKIIFDTNTEEKFMPCDVAKIQKAILILLSNIIKYSNVKEVFVKLHAIDTNIDISISFKNKDKMLLNFFKSKMDNLNDYSIEDNSVGFYICKSIISLHEGQLELTDNGKEANFLIQLPCDNTNSILYLYRNDKILNSASLTEQIQIEFSDLYEYK